MENSESAAIVKAITGLGESLGMPITAEGIEDKEIENELRNIGCAKGQGWYYGRPLSMEQTRKILAERNLLPTQRIEETVQSENISEQADVVADDQPERKAG